MNLIHNGYIPKSPNPNVFLDLEHYTRFQRIINFQQFANRASHHEIAEEFVRLSCIIFDSDFDNDPNDHTTIYDYNSMCLIEDDLLGTREIEFYTGVNITRLRVIIPCMFGNLHMGVNCRLIDHLNGIGCPQCAEHFGISSVFPME